MRICTCRNKSRKGMSDDERRIRLRGGFFFHTMSRRPIPAIGRTQLIGVYCRPITYQAQEIKTASIAVVRGGSADGMQSNAKRHAATYAGSAALAASMMTMDAKNRHARVNAIMPRSHFFAARLPCCPQRKIGQTSQNLLCSSTMKN